jgi:hypothetical protein
MGVFFEITKSVSFSGGPQQSECGKLPKLPAAGSAMFEVLN